MICKYVIKKNNIKIIDQTITQKLIAQSIVRVPDFWRTTTRMAILTYSLILYIVCYFRLVHKLVHGPYTKTLPPPPPGDFWRQ